MNNVYNVDENSVDIGANTLTISLPASASIEANDIEYFDVDIIISGNKYTLTVLDVIPGDNIVNIVCIRPDNFNI